MKVWMYEWKDVKLDERKSKGRFGLIRESSSETVFESAYAPGNEREETEREVFGIIGIECEYCVVRRLKCLCW